MTALLRTEFQRVNGIAEVVQCMRNAVRHGKYGETVVKVRPVQVVEPYSFSSLR
jgi:hypothetical protein